MCLPSAERLINVSRRLPRDTARRTSFLLTNRSHNLVAVEACTARASASCPTCCGPRDARTTNARYWGRVTSVSIDANDRAATATSARGRGEECISDGGALGRCTLMCSRQHLYTTHDLQPGADPSTAWLDSRLVAVPTASGSADLDLGAPPRRHARQLAVDRCGTQAPRRHHSHAK